jgi:hypothetical protein
MIPVGTASYGDNATKANDGTTTKEPADSDASASSWERKLYIGMEKAEVLALLGTYDRKIDSLAMRTLIWNVGGGRQIHISFVANRLVRASEVTSECDERIILQ